MRHHLGRLSLTDYRPFVPIVGEAYLARPVFEKDQVKSWKALIKHTDEFYDKILQKVDVQFVSQDPYPDYPSMKRDIVENRRMKIFTGNSEHAVFSPEENWRFRAVHDYLIHATGDHGFTLRGEMGAYNRHVKIAPPAARTALFTEIVGQTCTYFFLGEKFAEQKIAKLYGFDYVNVGVWDREEYERNFLV